MKKIFSFLFALLFMAGTTGVFTSCQEDAPEINYTLNVTVNNDFTEVVNAINNGTMKQEAAIAALTAAINGMTGSEPAKLDALIEAINKLASTIDAKLAVLEAAMKAQTLALEAKFDLLEAAIKALEGQYADELAALTASIDAIKAAVEAGNLSQEEASAKILALLEGIDTAVNPDYVTFTADAEQTLRYGGSDLQYSIDGITFNHLPANTPITFGGTTILYLRGVNNLDGNYFDLGGLTAFHTISFGKNDVPVACTGDIRTLIDYKTYKTVDTSNAVFGCLFEGCTELTSAPALPATDLADYCYNGMFYGCEKLTDAPELPATTLAQDCYNKMFYGCKKLTEAPELPATTLADNCYNHMFFDCTSLNKITMLATDISATDCLYNWVSGVAATGTFTKNASATYDPSTIGIPTGWTVNP